MFNFLWKKNNNTIEEKIEPIDNDDCLASITYFVSKEHGPMIDVGLMDYDKQSIEALFSLLDILSGTQFYVDTVEMIRDSLIKDNKANILVSLKQHLEKRLTTQVAEQVKLFKDEPCISPSDMLS